MRKNINIILLVCIFFVTQFSISVIAESTYSETKVYLQSLKNGEVSERLYSADEISFNPGQAMHFGIEDNLSKKMNTAKCEFIFEDGEVVSGGAMGFYIDFANSESGDSGESEKISRPFNAPNKLGSCTVNITINYRDNSKEQFGFNAIIENRRLSIEIYDIGTYSGQKNKEAYRISYLYNVIGKNNGASIEWNEELFPKVAVYNSKGINCILPDTFTGSSFEIEKEAYQNKYTLFLPQGVLKSFSPPSEDDYEARKLDLINGDINIEFEIPEIKYEESRFIDTVYPTNRGTYYLKAEKEEMEYKITLKPGFKVNDKTKLTVSGRNVEFTVTEQDGKNTILIPMSVVPLSSGSVFLDEGFAVNEKGEYNGRTALMFFTELRDNISLPDNAIFTDVSKEHWAYNQISELCSKGIISGYEDGTFKPEGFITRAELSKILVTAFNYDAEIQSVYVDTEKHWAKDYIMKSTGLIHLRTSDTFLPDELATREEVAASISKTLPEKITSKSELKFTDINDISADLLNDIKKAIGEKIIYGYEDGSFLPKENITRSEVVTMIYRVLNK